MKRNLKDLNWQNGNIFEKAVMLKAKLETAQQLIDKNHHDTKLRVDAADEEVNNMISEVSEEEFKSTMFDIGSDKASCRDGYTSCFFKNSWNIMGKDICAAVKEFFDSGKLLKEKAYDTISWEFLENVLKKFGFHQKMVNWIVTCITTSHFSICVNGEIHGYFKGGRGLRQGDPIFPYLFSLVIEVLSLIMTKHIENSKGFKYHFGCKKLKLYHVCFAVDLLVLCHGDTFFVAVIKKALDEFSQVSVGKLPMRYLGAPLLAKRLSVADCKSLIDKLLKDFLWNQGEIVRGKSKVAWKNVCKLKKCGGLGIKSLKLWNELILKQLWKIIDKKKSLWVNWVNVVKLKGRSICDIKTKVADSWGWK
ncbi:uncharacterized protein [Rutidosis leptorrhynchoides]|uniref:uncharacterized protein n=1 Tax=Rutidosis leptorrhynchoides TaxID=125765 RepID=UPI003A9A1A51